ncbi:MAG: acetate kinase [Candidatus Izimaplasma sp.]|nr:acetate kinase [Candidatus Izimaplasma bacterium]
MSKIMAVNAGSSSLKFQLLKMPEEKMITSGIVERIGMKKSVFSIKVNGEKIEETTSIPNHGNAVNILLQKLIEHNIIEGYDEIAGVGHRVVHGGDKISESVVLDEEKIEYLEGIIDLAPLHLGPNLTGIKAFQKVLPNVKHVGVFDTAFHQTMPEEAYLYAVPYDWFANHKVRKYGFHGTSHKFITQRYAEMMNKEVKDVNLIIAHIGNGASICAVKNGKSIDTSMGFTPLEGIPMGTRSGNIDPAVVEYMMKVKKKSVKEIMNYLNKQSGYLGVSGLSSDSRDLVAASKSGNHQAKLAIDVQAKRITDYIAAYNNYVGGADAIIFTAGIGENAIYTRALIGSKLSSLGVEIDDERNDCRGVEKKISSDKSKIDVYVIPTNEEVMIARDTMALL